MCCLGFIVGDRLMIFVEAQSTWSDNIVIRSLLYMSQTIQEYIMQSDQYIYGTKRVSFPKPELYVLYTGARKTRPNKLRFSEVFFGGEPCDIDVTVHMLYDGKEGDIINQYVTFLKVCFAQFKLYGRNQKAVLEAIRICKDENILKEYLMSREKEVVNIMMMLYDQEYIFNGFLKEQREIGREEGLAAGRAEAEARIKAEREAAEAKLKAAEEKAKADSESQFKNTARTLQGIGLPIEQIAAAVNRSVNTVRQWLYPASMDSFPKA